MMVGSEPRITDVGRDRSTNCATTTTQLLFSVPLVPWVRRLQACLLKKDEDVTFDEKFQFQLLLLKRMSPSKDANLRSEQF